MKLPAVLTALWRREPVLIRTGLPELVALGILTAHQASWISGTATAVATLVAQAVALVGAVRARAKVKVAAVK